MTSSQNNNNNNNNNNDDDDDDEDNVIALPYNIFETFRYRGGGDDNDDATTPLTKVPYNEKERARNKQSYLQWCREKRFYRQRKQREYTKAWRQQPANRYKIYMKSAQRRKLDFTLTLAQCKTLFATPCHYCNIMPSESYLNGIDRVKNDLGYSPDNVVASCWVCNRMKHASPYDQFLEQCKRIQSHTRGSVLPKLD